MSTKRKGRRYRNSTLNSIHVAKRESVGPRQGQGEPSALKGRALALFTICQNAPQLEMRDDRSVATSLRTHALLAVYLSG